MEKSYINLSIPNFISVGLMVLVFLGVLGLIHRMTGKGLNTEKLIEGSMEKNAADQS